MEYGGAGPCGLPVSSVRVTEGPAFMVYTKGPARTGTEGPAFMAGP